MPRFKAIVSGGVQGVCFRAETVEVARRLGLNGYAKNLPDGTVEVVAEGDRGALEKLADFLSHGPTLARVENLEIDWGYEGEAGEGFRIEY